MELIQLNREIEDFKTKRVQIVPGFYFNQYDTINQNYFYYNSKFKTGEIDEEGDRKYFFNINKNPCKVYTKSIDFDTKNIRLLTAGGGDPLKTWFFERDLKYWMRKVEFGKVLNRVFKELPIFGSVVIKIVNGKPEFVDLRNFVVEQGADNLAYANYITEIHNYTPSKFKQVAKKMKWDKKKVKETLKLYGEMKDTSHIRLYERYGQVDETTDSGDINSSYRKVIFADVGVDEYDAYQRLTATKLGVELFNEEWDVEKVNDLYWEFHADKTAGRWLGCGVVETLTEPQIRENEIANLQSKGSYWASLRLFFSRDPKMAGNLITDKRNGEVLIGDDAITQIDMSDRNLAFFNEETRKWLNNRDELSFSYDAVQGERSPAGTPLGSTQISIGQTLSYFEGIQEEIALQLKQMLYKVILPQFEKENKPEHTLRLVGQDLDKYIEMVKNQMVFEQITKMAIESLIGKPFPTEDDKEVVGLAIEESIRQGKEKILDIPKGYYEGIKYDIDIDITGESVDTRVRQATIFAVLQAITTDPTMTQDPTKRKILYMMLENGGISPDDILDTPKKDVAQVMQEKQGGAGGGVSAPSLTNNIPGQGVNTL